ncbi:ATP-dependent RecD-like DNA helicase [Mobilitalea sibirica]|uniref:ATP-dependent RecD2 DNA helicase n=1 Tax=Mobilitalea sibirica TaxID=1462919 RepID=A0A8J7H4N9_9FIRM|nr:ATP-dependent RecD-like DNA helicase [Mobilitalea sibirica]MBH1942450.1 ATP-dependent RecD-like DNA helicase [Mobilitalea sibirica]
MAEVIEGYVDKIVFRNDDNGYTVLSLIKDEDEITCVGSFTLISEGEFIQASGNYTEHPVYGEQFLMESYELKEPEDVYSIERYLSSGAIKGVGAALAARIVKKFGEGTFRIIVEDPGRLAEVKGISGRMAMEIYRQFEEKRDMRSAMMFLQKYNVSGNLAVKIFQEYGQRMYDIIKENPYRLAEDIVGVGFKTADEIAQKVGIGNDSDYRVKAGILYVLLQAGSDGHVYLPEQELIQKCKSLLLTDTENINRQITSLTIEKKIIIREGDNNKPVYSSVFYYMELNVARMLCDLNIRLDMDGEYIRNRLSFIEKQFLIELDDHQRTAVMEAAGNGLLIITGGPGTGKTTTINAIIKFFESEGMDILLAAPTGRAAKRMTETTGYEAKTIHRLLELSRLAQDQENKFSFERNENNPLETDVLIIDEMSMVDISLMNALLKAVSVGTRLILVGDVNQLPSVGPGNVLKDIINSHNFNVVKLTKIFRQAADSDIIVNAHKINAGEQISLDNKSKDFFFLKREDYNVITAVMINLIKNKLPSYVNATPYDIQVLTPMRKGELGVERLNQVLQQALNPPYQDKKEKEYHQTIYREGDKVMQVKNNYQLTWEIKSKYGITTQSGTGVFNGDAGIVKEINLFSEHLVVEFDDNRLVNYSFSQLDELELAYAVTIHKSQGSEYPAVILPILDGPRLLFNRNLLYTAVTRAKCCVTIVGSDSMIKFMIDNKSEQSRYSGLCERIRELR